MILVLGKKASLPIIENIWAGDVTVAEPLSRVQKVLGSTPSTEKKIIVKKK
jgi:hypothetical protein